MAEKKKSKLGAKAIFARILAVILVTAIGGVASFFGFKTYFSNKLKKDKKAEIAKQLKEESKERVDVGMIQTGNSIVIRIYHNKNQEMIFVPLRQDMNLTLTKKGKQAVEQTLGTSVSKATVADVIKATRKNGKLLRQQVEKTLGISINSYELISHKKFVKLMNQAGDVKIEFDEAMAYTDSTDKYVTLSAGENSLNGTAIYSLLSESDIFTDKNKQAEITGEICVAVASALNDKTLSEYRAHVADDGWQDYVADGEQAGTTGQSKAIQAVQIRLTGEKKDEYQILYRAHVANDGWQNYVTTDEIAGTTGESKDLQAIQIVLLKKEKDVDVENKDFLSYSTSVQDLGWTGQVKNGEQSGTVGLSKAIQSIKINANLADLNVEYSTYRDSSA